MGKFLLAVSTLICTALVGIAVAQEPQPQQPPPPAPKQAQKKPEQKPDKAPDKAADKTAEKAAATPQAAEIVSIDATKNQIVIKDEAGAEVHLLTSASTKITRDGKDITLADLKAGDRLSWECEDSPDGCKATVIKVIPAATKK